MKTQKERFESIVPSSVRVLRTTRAPRWLLPLGAALLAGCGNLGPTSDIDAEPTGVDEQALLDKDIAESAMLDGDGDSDELLGDGEDDQIAGSDTDVSTLGDEIIVEVPLDTTAMDDLLVHEVLAPDAVDDGLSEPLSSELPESSAKVVDPSNVSFNTCTASLTGCTIVGSAGSKLACGADLFAIVFGQPELAAPLSAWCYTALFGQGGACIAAAGLCDAVPTSPVHPAPNPPTRYLAKAGIDHSSDVEKAWHCPDHERVKKVTVWKQNNALQYVSQIQLECTGGTTQTFGTKNANDIAGTMACDPNKEELVSGFRMRHGQYVDAIGARCQPVGYANNASQTEFGGTQFAAWGGSGGTLETFECPQHTYLRGMKAHSLTVAAGKVINYIQLRCR